MNNRKNLIDTYQRLKKEFYSYGIVTGTKSKVFDLVVFSLKEDIYIKIIKPDEKKNIPELIAYMKGFTFKRRYINCRYILIILNHNLQESEREIIKLN